MKGGGVHGGVPYIYIYDTDAFKRVHEAYSVRNRLRTCQQELARRIDECLALIKLPSAGLLEHGQYLHNSSVACRSASFRPRQAHHQPLWQRRPRGQDGPHPEVPFLGFD